MKVLFTTDRRVIELDAEGLVRLACDAEAHFASGDLERAAARARALEGIVGRMLEAMPEDRWLDIVQTYAAELAP